ncbi:hypothetical protein XELAEV_18036336mg [Xenopus laevis]|uniref:Ig-like domain-containing protein n=1 Tax=Xenopus laevis TaxID=8355 RepID=A0A974HCW5_XENLA|nr:hypothetical protein XELAEV_18036336mg [Xenopus laevis]
MILTFPLFQTDPPKNTTVSILGDPDIQEGDEVTLSCNCRANPEIQTYLWFKGMESAGEGQNITLKNVKWTIEPYSCTARNIQGEGKSAGVVIPVKSETPNYTDSASEQTSSMYGLIALLPILLILFFILRRLKIKWCPLNQGSNNAESQFSEPIYLDIKERDRFKESSDVKDSTSADNPYTALTKRESLIYGDIKGSQSTDHAYSALHLQDDEPYDEIKTGITAQNDPE